MSETPQDFIQNDSDRKAVEEGCYVDLSKGQRVIEFISKYCRHTKGIFAGQPVQLLEWQKDFVNRVFGWQKPDGTRRFRHAFLLVPRKNGKTTLAACICLYLLFGDHEAGAEIVSVSTDRKSADLSFATARQMVLQDETLSSLCEITRVSIYIPKNGSVFKVLASDTNSLHGMNTSGILFDEIHAQKDRSMYDVLRTSMGARSQPLMLCISTAGIETHGPCFEQYEYTKRIAEGTVIDPDFYGTVYEADLEDDWQSPEIWRKANPSLGTTITEDFLRTEANNAKNTPTFQRSFQRLYLNKWIQDNEHSWLETDAWNKCKQDFAEEGLVGCPCFAGLDLSSTLDLTAFGLVFDTPDGPKALCRFWLPEVNLEKRVLKDHVPYDVWRDEGWLRTTPGNAIDYDTIVKDILKDAEQFNLKEIAFDRWNSSHVVNMLTNAGLILLPFGQGFKSMGTPTKDLTRAILQQEISHRGNKILDWNIQNAVIETDAAECWKLSKQKSRERIDGAVALIMAWDRFTASKAEQPKRKKSVYEDRGIIGLNNDNLITV